MRSVARNIIRGAVVVLIVVSLPSISAAPRTTTTIKVMTQNMDAGTDLGLALAYLNTDTPTVGIDLTYQEILQGNLEGRAAILAQQIAASQPDLVSLQEVTLWSLDFAPLFDQLDLLQNALADLGQNYSVVKVNEITSLAAPTSDFHLLGFLDRDVILSRDDAALSIANIQSGKFAASFTIPDTPLGDITVEQGWISAEVTLDGDTFTFVDTHLASSFPGLDLSQVQDLQAQELAALFGGTTRLVIAGDFNSNATHTPVEHTPSYATMLDAGLTDTWVAAHRGQPGFTWPLYVEDPLGIHPAGPFERIDLIFETGLGIESVNRIGWTGRHASDHAGVIATLSF